MAKFVIRSASFIPSGSTKIVSEKELERLAKNIEYSVIEVI